MAVISIVGTSGAGKSFLTAQLASLNCMPAFLEGEEGVIPQEIFTKVFVGDPVGRFGYFVDKYNKNLSRARKVSDSGLDAYVDGAILSIEAHLPYEEEQYHDSLRKVLDKVERNESDVIVLLTATADKLKDSLKKRGRNTEQEDEAVKRSLVIQDQFISLSKKQNNVLEVDRTMLDFGNEDHLRQIDKMVKDFLAR